jgi:anti-sigma factor RsiW
MPEMTCEEADVLLHALIDDELDAGHAHEVESHAANCARCASELRRQRELRRLLAAADLRFRAPPGLSRRIEQKLHLTRPLAPDRRAMLKGFAMGSVMSAALAASLVLFVSPGEQDQQNLGDVVSAHLRSLQGEHLTDVQTSDQHVVRPWFNGRLDLAPPVIDLTAQDFALVGGRLDYIDGRPVAAIVYKRRQHVINLFVSKHSGSAPEPVSLKTVQGYNVLRWADQDLEFMAVSDLNSTELKEFEQKFQAALHAGSAK